MNPTLGFDVYGTLIDTHGVKRALREHLGERAEGFSRLWREKQLEYSFRRGLMQNYVDFSRCTSQALDYACLEYGLDLHREQKQRLLATYRELPPFDDAIAGLEKAQKAGFALYAFSNGSAEAVTSLLHNAGLLGFFVDVISVEDLRTFKPSPAVYCHFLRRTGAFGSRAWMVSSNPFDVIGAVSAGMRAAWVRRSESAIFDPWEMEPTLTVSGLEELAYRIDKE
jgi:2-haloacid dehalogenase